MTKFMNRELNSKILSEIKIYYEAKCFGVKIGMEIYRVQK